MSKNLNGIYHFFRNRHFSSNVEIDTTSIHTLINNYCKKEKNFIGTIEECAKLIQEDFKDFIHWINHRSSKKDRNEKLKS